MLGSESQKLEYFVSEKNGFMVVTVSGTLSRATSAQFERIKIDLAQSQSKNIVLNFHGLSRLEQGGIPSLVRIQQFIRSRAAVLRICFLKAEYYKLLDEAGAVRPNEVLDNLLEALKSFPPAQQVA